MSEFDSFMEWFEINHPALCKKYKENITISPADGKTVAVNNNNKISQKEFDHLYHVASSYYSKADLDLFDSVKFVYGDGMPKNENDELNMLLNVTMWLRPFIKEINKSTGVVRITFIRPGFNAYWVENISDELIQKARSRAEQFAAPYHPDNNL